MKKSQALLADLIEERLQPGADTEEVDRRIQTLFGERWCVVFTDMAGFSRSAARSGIIPFLVLMHQLDTLLLPIIRKNAGFVLKTIADSYMLLFRGPRPALKACVEMEQALIRHNEQAAEADQLYMGCGIGYGDCLKLGDEDIYGVEVNFAAKLGEDLAGPYQIFLTPAAVKAIGRVAGVTFKKVPGSRLGGTDLPYYEAVYPIPKEAAKATKSRVRFK